MKGGGGPHLILSKKTIVFEEEKFHKVNLARENFGTANLARDGNKLDTHAVDDPNASKTDCWVSKALNFVLFLMF